MKSFLLYLSKQHWIKGVLTKIPVANRVATRFVAGETIDQVVDVIRQQNAKGMTVTVDHLGEHVKDPKEVEEAHDQYLTLLDRIHTLKLNANVSVKLTEMGLDIDPDLCRKNMESLIQKAATHETFVRIDMESSAYTQRTLDSFHELHGRYKNVGIVLQAYLHRTKADLEKVLAAGARVRLCKGAYDEPPSVAFENKTETDENYKALARMMLDSGIYHGLATHDPAMIDDAIAYAKSRNYSADRFEFQMLYGVRRDLQEKLLKEGWRVRVYVPYGANWYPYLMRRMAERPANLGFVLKSLVKG
jgi:proline dehydrogenase